MVGNKTVEIAVVVDVAEISRPALRADTKPGCIVDILRVSAVSIVQKQLVDPARIGRVGHALAAFGNIQVRQSVVVYIAPDRAVIA